MNAAGIAYQETGKGQVALVFLHFFGGSGATWQAVTAELSPGHRCICLDIPGFGSSPALDDPMSLDGFADAIEHFTRTISLHEYALVGHSMGGKIALALAARQPQGLQSLMLVAPSPPTPEPMSNSDRQKLQEMFGDEARIAAHLQHISASPLPSGVIECETRLQMQASATAWHWWLGHGSKEDISDVMKKILVPALLVAGEKDVGFPPGFLKTQVVAQLTNATLRTVQNTGHLIHIEKPAQLAEAIAQFQKKINT